MVALALLGAVSTIGFAYNLATFIAEVFTKRQLPSSLVTIYAVVGFGAARAALIWIQEWLSTRASAIAKVELREAFFAAVARLGHQWTKSRNTSDISLLAIHRIDALDAYFARFIPSLFATALVTPAIALVIWRTDFWSGVAVACTLPLIPLFMIFIGWATQSVQTQQLISMRVLSRHFGEVLRGLTTLRVFGRLPHQPEAIAASSETFRIRTMKVLRMSFLSGMALEIAASLSVALVAVSIGLRLIDGSLLLGPGLFALLLAPEAYLPLRQVGANFHASNEGILASKEILDVIQSVEPTHEKSVELLEKFRPGVVTHLTGPSGAGKTTLLTRVRDQLPVGQVSYMTQRVALFRGTVLDNIAGPNRAYSPEALATAVAFAALDDVPMDMAVGSAASGLSGGQAQRVALARVFYRALTLNSRWVIFDEPLSALDDTRARRVAAAIATMAESGARVVVASHQPMAISTVELAVADV